MINKNLILETLGINLHKNVTITSGKNDLTSIFVTQYAAILHLFFHLTQFRAKLLGTEIIVAFFFYEISCFFCTKF